MPLVVGTAGHIDHGKTWLVRALTGKDTDRLPEEHERGISIDLGYAPLELPGGLHLSLVDVPGHLFLLVDTGVHQRNRLALALDEGLTVIADDEVWIPLESTAIGKGFAEAWRLGAEGYASWASRGRLTLVDVTTAQERYQPGDSPMRLAASGSRAAARSTPSATRSPTPPPGTFPWYRHRRASRTATIRSSRSSSAPRTRSGRSSSSDRIRSGGTRST